MAHRIRLKTRDRLELFSDLSTMLKAGIPILEAVEALEEDAKGDSKLVLTKLRHTLVNGQPLSRAMEQLPHTFDQVTVNLVRAAEAGGMLEETLSDMVASTQKDLAFSENLRTTMIYPAFVMAVFLAIMLLMLTFVIPRVAKVFNGMRVHMPPVTRVMIAISDFFMAHWLFVTLAAIVLVVGIGAIIAAYRQSLVRSLLRLPGLQQLGRNIDLTRFTRSFALLMHAGVPLEQTLELSQQVVRSKEIGLVVQRMRTNISLGYSLSHGLRDTHGVLPPILNRSLETAETAGTLEETMQNLTDYFEGQVASSLKTISSMVEPALLVVVGVLVGTLMITIIAPIYNLISQINPKGM